MARSKKGAQNLPGNWESSKFDPPVSLAEGIPQIGEHDTAVVKHKEVPYMHDVKRWSVLTIGTGLGNARFTYRNRKSER